MIEIKNNEMIHDEKKYVLLQFWASWCGPCTMLKPVIEDLSKDSDLESISFQRVDIDANQKLTAQYEVYSVPSILLFEDGKLIQKLVGYKPKEVLKVEIANALKLSCSLIK